MALKKKLKKKKSRPSFTVLGLDVSITSTGYCVMCQTGVIDVSSIYTAPNKKTFDPWDDMKRFNEIVDRIEFLIELHEPVKIFIEAPAYGAHDNGGRQAQLRGLILNHLYHKHPNLYPIDIAPTKLKKFITGSGKGSKNLMGEAVRRRYPNELLNVRFTNDDEIDAFAIAKFGQVSILVSSGALDITKLIKPQQESLKGYY